MSVKEDPLNKRAPEEELHKVIYSDDIQQMDEEAKPSLEEIHLPDNSAAEDEFSRLSEDVLRCCSASMSIQKQSNTQTIEIFIKAELQPKEEN
ncbi:uncharacterized protein LOC124370896 isoform X2 [Homalodisca vitripennis]|nr:uncharacterized protein LOC124370896 isoform X2 [Homalodisca vitripennis]